MQNNQKKKLKQNSAIVALILFAIITLSLVGAMAWARFVLDSQNDVGLTFYEYRIQTSEIVISPEEYTGRRSNSYNSYRKTWIINSIST